MRRNNLNVLVIGSGGREHALAWKLAESPRVDKIYCAPGNAGCALVAENFDAKVTDFDKLIRFAKEKRIDFVLVGPETPLIAGMVDRFQAEGIPAFGPSQSGAELEGSKAFTKTLLRDNGIPTGDFAVFSDPNEAAERVRLHFSRNESPIVIKADGEAAGKGVIIAASEADALAAVDAIMTQRVFGDSGDKILIEELLEGQEASVMAFVDGDVVRGMKPAQDYKRARDNDAGPNTGGMGCYSPVPVVTEEVYEYVIDEMIRPTLAALKQKGVHYKGVLYAGVILTDKGPKLLEYNCRFGDPETQVVMPLLETDLVDIIEAVIEGSLDDIDIKWYNRKAISVILASGGYPGDYRSGFEVKGLSSPELRDAIVFHAGTKNRDGNTVTAGGRVLAVTATGDSFKDARERAYAAVSKIEFDDMQYRTDIGARVV